MSTAPWFRVSVSASQTLLANAGSLCQVLARCAGVDQSEVPEVGALLQQALRNAIGRGDTAEPLVEVVCRAVDGRFEAQVSRDGQALDTIVRPLAKPV
ncbi:MAG: hypothetical protein HYZ58_00610 [Acidobacteria bacterium]|nr:hypothetical protein [Acidobacteriota bacterium]MBI3261633.1 hypothetical protein [Acidobacteriota bacterium]